MSPKPYQVTGHSSVQNLRTASHRQKESSNSAAPPIPRSPPTPPPSRSWSSTPNDTQPAPAHGSKARGRPSPAPFHDGNSPKSRTMGLHHVSTQCPTHIEALKCVELQFQRTIKESTSRFAVAGLGTLSRHPAVPRSHGTGEHLSVCGCGLMLPGGLSPPV